MTYEQWEVVVVPFPFVDAPRSKQRPVVIISKAAFHKAERQYIAAMITTAARSGWSGDTPISALEEAGLSHASIVRLKIFTLDERLIIKKVGTLAKQDRIRVRKSLQRFLL